MKPVIVVTCPELGWDCVVGVYQDVTIEELEAAFPHPDYVHTEMDLEITAPERDNDE